MISDFPRLILKPSKQVSALRGHQWIFSGAVGSVEGSPANGDTVEVLASDRTFIGLGHYQKSSIMVRLFSFERTEPDADFWAGKLEQALRLRRELGLVRNPETTMYRLVHGEGDSIPGLVIDIYNNTAVLECHSSGMARIRPLITEALSRVAGGDLHAVYDKQAGKGEYLLGPPADPSHSLPARTSENGQGFFINWEEGQKTGFYLDQRENRFLLSRYAPGKSMLNAFSYTGGFSVYAGSAGARRVVSVDSSARALETLRENIRINPPAGGSHDIVQQDAFDFLKSSEEHFDLIVLDPPAFAKHQSSRHQAVQAYKRLNHLALSRLNSPGILFTFSCSQVVDVPLFEGAVRAAVIESGRKAIVLHKLRQAPDHPVSLLHPESEYLKGLVLQVM